ncbi:hypothetical protein C8Q79DRAFT_1009241 [Trametes meyenii]|nr:hypothetical protein C8Q79DRAFT_1009241 [Trametes meyenii]
MLPATPVFRVLNAAQRRALTVAAVSCRRGVALCIPTRRHYSSPSPSPPPPPLDVNALDQWISADKQLTLHDTIRPEHLADLYITLPTRDGSTRAFAPPQKGAPLSYGHHLVFFHPRNPEGALRSDGTDTDFCPPEPFTRRMWAGGRMEWKRPLCVGDEATAQATIGAVTKKGFERAAPMVFVSQKIQYKERKSGAVCIEEERAHVYLAGSGNKRVAKEVNDLPVPDFAFEYLPSPTTLFRFSALTFNGHYIHLDKDYAQQSEGYPERLVHGPLTALMLLDVAALHFPGSSFKTFEYRAVNPIVVNRPVKIYGTQIDKQTVMVWAEETASKAVGMTGKVTFAVLNASGVYLHRLFPSPTTFNRLIYTQVFHKWPPRHVPQPASSASKAPASTAQKALVKSESKAKKTAAKSTSSGAADSDKKKRKKVRKETWSSYVYKVLKQVHPDTGISNKAMAILNSFVNDIFERIATEASKLSSYSKKSTISSREIQTAVRLILPGELAKHAISEGTKSVTKFSSSQK